MRGQWRKMMKLKTEIRKDKAQQLVKLLTVLLRDLSPMTYHEASLQLAYCWKNTEKSHPRRRKAPEAGP